MQWIEKFPGGNIGQGHAMDFLAGSPMPGRSLREAGVPELYRRGSQL